MSRIACPDCGGDLGPRASKCRCGWKAAVEQAKDANPGHVPCTGNPGCRYPGRIWTRHLQSNERICVTHYYRALEQDSSIAFDDVVPPTTQKMPGVQAKPVTSDA